jgi:diamine N-acetyltransferase
MDRWRDVTKHEDDFPVPRPMHDGGVVSLRPVTSETVRAICRLAVAPSQVGFVAPNAISIAEGSVTPNAWFRAIYADETPVGFVMLERSPKTHEYGLWRFMIAEPYQRFGYGRRALELVVDQVRTDDPAATELMTSWGPGEGGPEPFYVKFGFEPTGDVEEGELVGRLRLRWIGGRNDDAGRPGSRRPAFVVRTT